VDTGSRQVRAAYARQAQADNAAVQALFRKLRIDALSLSTERPFIDDVHRLFRQRQSRAGHG
jgi:uncharacterized protein (DUF58 family)